MRKIITSSLIVFTLFISACKFNQSVNKDLKTGAYSQGDGIGCEKVSIKINGNTENKNEFVFGQKVELVFDGISGLTMRDNKTYPGLAMYIVKNNKDTVLSNPDLLTNMDAGTEISPLQLKANFRAMMPYQANEKYKLYIVISDKKGNGKFTYELPFTIKENKLLSIKSNGIQYTSIYLWNETLKQPVFEENVKSDESYILILEGIAGLEIINEKQYPVFSIEITDSEGNKILSNPNLLRKFETRGIDPGDIKDQLTANISFSKGKINNPYQLVAVLKDKNSSKEIEIKTQLRIAQ